MKRQIPPPDIRQRRAFPPLRDEVVRIGAVEVFSAVEVVGDEADADASGDEDRGRAVRAAAAGEVGGFEGDADVDGDGGVEAEG